MSTAPLTAGTRPCSYPGCKDPSDPDGNPRSTSDGMCVEVMRNGRPRGCQANFRRDLRHLVLDWVQLRRQLPAPLRQADHPTRNHTREYGHPAEWASDTCDLITAVLNWTHDALADSLGQTPPPHPGTGEHIQVRSAWNYLDSHFTELCRQDWARDTAIEIRELHNKIRARLGHTRPRIILPTPCPRCEQLTLVRTIDFRRDQIDCGNCDHQIREDHYAFYTELLLDTLTRPVGTTAAV